MKLLRNVLIAMLLLAAAVTEVSANSALMYWYGSDSSDVYMLSEDCPVTVSHEKLTFNINQLPEDRYTFDNHSSLNELDSTVTAAYSFHNPADYDVTATLYFPFGENPYYALGAKLFTSERYLITADGKPVNRQLRYHYQQGDFDIAEAIRLLQDEKITDDIFHGDAVITRYDYHIETYAGIYCDMAIPKGRIALISRISGYDDEVKGKTHFGVFYGISEDEMDFSVYLFGENNYIEDIGFYTTAACEEEVDNTLTLKGTEKMKLKDLLSSMPVIEGMNEVDRYNCFVTMLRKTSEVLPVISIAEISSMFEENLTCGYVYKLTVPAGKTVINEVTAPLYPSIDHRYNPPYYDFTYLSSPAKTWAGFNDLDIEINTTHVITEFSGGQLSRGADGVYRIHLEGLPEKEITFRLYKSDNPVPQKDTSYNIISWFILGAMGLALIIFVALIILIIKLISRRKKRKQNS